MQYSLSQVPDYFQTQLSQHQNAGWRSQPSEQRHEMMIITVEWVYLWGLQWIMLIEWKKLRGLNKTYTGKNLILLRGLQPALSSLPTGFLKEGMSSLLAKGPNPLPQCQHSPQADWNLGHPRARQGTCNHRTDTQSDMQTNRHIQAL